MNKKLILIAIFGLYIPFNGLAIESTTKESIKPHISNFNPERDTQPIIDIFNENRHWLSDMDSSFYESFLKECHNHPSCNIRILRENDELAGYIIYLNKPSQGRITDLAVADNFRNKGYGKFLISTALKELYDKNVDYIDLACSTNNAPALNLYKKMGFKKMHDYGKEVTLKHKKKDYIKT